MYNLEGRLIFSSDLKSFCLFYQSLLPAQSGSMVANQKTSL